MTRSKYGAKKVTIDGITFDSKAEAKFYTQLKDNGVEFELQPRFLLQSSFKKNGKNFRKIEYIADFKIGNRIIDIKGMETEAFKIKKKLFEYKYPELRLELLRECPKKHMHHGTFGFIELELYKKICKK
ncbi:DUF1064 domain-containing protein [Cetobacterium somerae]|uniref:DUF1064 domain-containing protein n=1 Tax=Cetobacterium somerae TaxID=188913 RepID=UPI003D7696D5